jgi:Right handed beta helix region
MHTSHSPTCACAPSRRPASARSAAVLLALLSSLWPAALLAGTYHVAERGNDEGPGSERTPWKTLQHAAEQVQPGDTVMVEPGTYDGFELERSGRPEARIRFVAKPGVIVDRGPESGSRDNINLEGASYIDVEGFEVTSAWRAGIRAVECQHVRVRGNHVHDNGVWGVFTGFCDDLLVENNVLSGSRRQHGLYVSNSPKRSVIRGNHIFGNRQAGIHLNGDASMGREGMVIDPLVENNLIHDNGKGGAAGINCDGCRGAVFRNNILHDNHANGITLYRIDARSPSTDNEVVHNTIWMSERSRWCIRIVDASVSNVFANNICITDHPTHGAIDIDQPSLRDFTSDGNAVVARFTTTDGNATLAMDGWRKQTGQDRRSITITGAITGTGAAAVTAAELFVDADGRDLRLRSGCAAIDKGIAELGVQHDYFGHRRPVGAAVDIGAIESCEGAACKRAYPHAGPPLSARAAARLGAPAPGVGQSAPAPETDPSAAAAQTATPEQPVAGEQAAQGAPAAPPASDPGAGAQPPNGADGADGAPAQHLPPATPNRAGGGCCKSQATAEPPASSIALAALVLLLLRRRGRADGRG